MRPVLQAALDRVIAEDQNRQSAEIIRLPPRAEQKRDPKQLLALPPTSNDGRSVRERSGKV